MTEQVGMEGIRNGNDDLKQVITRIGTLMRTLRESMRELGLEKRSTGSGEYSRRKDRLRYIAQMTAQAAEKP